MNATTARQTAREQRAITPGGGVSRINPWLSGEKADEIERFADTLRDYDAEVFLFTSVRDRNLQVDSAVLVEGLPVSEQRRCEEFIRENDLGRVVATHLLMSVEAEPEPGPFLSIHSGAADWFRAVSLLLRRYVGCGGSHALVGEWGYCEFLLHEQEQTPEWGTFRWGGPVTDIPVSDWVGLFHSGNPREIGTYVVNRSSPVEWCNEHSSRMSLATQST